MSLFFTSKAFAKLADVRIDDEFSSQIDFGQREWRFTLLTNNENDVEICYLFQFDQNGDDIEVFYNGLDDAILEYDILALLLSHLPDLTFTLD